VSQEGKHKKPHIVQYILGALIVGIVLIPFFIAAYNAGIGLNISTFVLLYVAVALLIVFWLWARDYYAGRPSDIETVHEKVKELGFWGALKWKYKKEIKYRVYGILLMLISLLIVIIYVEIVNI